MRIGCGFLWEKTSQRGWNGAMKAGAGPSAAPEVMYLYLQGGHR